MYRNAQHMINDLLFVVEDCILTICKGLVRDRFGLEPLVQGGELGGFFRDTEVFGASVDVGDVFPKDSFVVDIVAVPYIHHVIVYLTVLYSNSNRLVFYK